MPIPTWSGAIAITASSSESVALGAASESRPYRLYPLYVVVCCGGTTRSGVITAPELHERQLSPCDEGAGQKAFAIVCKCAGDHEGASPASPGASGPGRRPFGGGRLL